jgi:DNA-binding beta-propeller fold protein YncE
LVSVFAALLAGAVLLTILLLATVSPQGFRSTVSTTAIAAYKQSIYSAGDGLLNRPSDVAVSPGGELFVADTGNRQICVYDSKGSFQRAIITLDGSEVADHADDEPLQPGQAVEPWRLESPMSLAFASDGRLYVVDSSLQMLLLFDAEGEFIRGISFDEETPTGVDVNVDSHGYERVYVTFRSGVATGDLDGSFDYAVMNWGREVAQFDNPTSVVTSGTATYVCDALNYRVQALTGFETSPVALWQFGSPLPAGEGLRYQGADRRFGFPVDMCLTGDGRLIVVDGLSSELVVLDAATGRFLYTVSDAGSDDGLLYYPAGITYSGRSIYVADKFNDRVTVFDDSVPTAEPQKVVAAGSGINRWWYFVPFLVLLAAALGRLLTIRAPRYLMDLGFLEALATDTVLLDFVRDNLRAIVVPLGIESYATRLFPAMKIDARVWDEEQLEELRAQVVRLDEHDAATLLVAEKLRDRDYLLTASAELAQAAETEGIAHLRYGEFRSLVYAGIKDAEEKGGVRMKVDEHQRP